MLLLSLKTCSLILPHLINAFQLLLLNFGFLLLHQSIMTHVIRSGHNLLRKPSMLLLLRYLRFNQIHLRSKLSSLLQGTILIGSAYVFVCVNIFKLLLIHKSLLHLLPFILTWHRSRTLLRSMLFHTVFTVSNLICVTTWGHYVSTLWTEGCVELVGVFGVSSCKTWKLIRMNLCHHRNLHLVWMNIIWLTSLMNLILFVSSRNIIISIQKLLAILQIHYHLLLLIMLIRLIWTWLWIEFTLSVKICLSGDLRKVRYFAGVVAGEARSLMLNWNLLLFLGMLTVGSICHSAMNIVSNTLLISITLILGYLLHIIGILLIPILRLHNIIIIYMLILI